VFTVTLGRFDPRTLGLAAARDDWRKRSHAIRFEGFNPTEARRTARQTQASKVMTLAGLLDLYGAQDGRAASWTKQLRPAVERVFKAHLATPLPRLALIELQATVDRWPSAKSAAFSLRALLTVIRWASVSSRKLVSPELLELTTNAAKPERDRVLQPAELAALLPTFAQASPVDPYAVAHRLILLCGFRRGEIAAARWAQIDLAAATWHLPTSKTGAAHTVQLSRQAVQLLQAVRPPHALPADHVLRDRGQPLYAWDAATARYRQASGVTGWTRHDLRRTSATILAELGCSDTLIKVALLNHAQPHSGVSGIYIRHRYIAEAREALQRLADRLDTIASGGAQVLTLPASAA
jgi:integrase